jgi:hypothetical protein
MEATSQFHTQTTLEEVYTVSTTQEAGQATSTLLFEVVKRKISVSLLGFQLPAVVYRQSIY